MLNVWRTLLISIVWLMTVVAYLPTRMFIRVSELCKNSKRQQRTTFSKEIVLTVETRVTLLRLAPLQPAGFVRFFIAVTGVTHVQ